MRWPWSRPERVAFKGLRIEQFVCEPGFLRSPVHVVRCGNCGIAFNEHDLDPRSCLTVSCPRCLETMPADALIKDYHDRIALSVYTPSKES